MPPTKADMIQSKNLLLPYSFFLCVINFGVIFLFLTNKIKNTTVHLMLTLSIMGTLSLSVTLLVFSLDIRRMKCN